jgi:fumarylpyruvate hydrolase
MTDFVFPLAQPSIAVKGTDARFPVRRVWCVGRNYAAHARELGNDDREPPFFFSKQPDMLVSGGGDIPYPGLTSDYHHEVELVVVLKGGGENISAEQAAGLIFGHAVGLDMTRRDLQRAAQDKKRSWEAAKSFDRSGPLGLLTPADGPLTRAGIRLTVNGQTRQQSDIANMTWNVAEVLAQLSRQVALAAGDVIFTGTPEGVGPVVTGDRLEALVDGLEPLSVTIV